MPKSILSSVAGKIVSYGLSVAFPGLSPVFLALAAGATSLVVNAAFASKAAGDAAGGGATQPITGRTQTVRQAVASRQVIYGQVRTGGILTFIQTTHNNAHLHMVITLAGHPVEEIGDIYFNDEHIPLDTDGRATGKYATYALVRKSLGDETTQPFPGLVSESGGLWTDAHRQAGCAKIYVQLIWGEHAPDLFPNGLPNVTAVVRGKRTYDPRSGTSYWNENSALAVADYLTSSNGLGVDYATEIDEAALIAAANICDEAMAKADGTSESRYWTNGTLLMSEAPRDVLPQLLGAMQGRAVFIGGVWKIYAGAYITPAVTLDENDARGPIRVSTRNSRRDNFNAVKGIFIDPDQNWQPVNFPPVTNALYLAQDNGERVWQDVNLRFTTSSSMAQRLAKIELERMRQQISVSYPAKLSAYVCEPPNTVMLDNTRFGWSGKVFDIGEMQLVIEQDDNGVPVLAVDLTLRETAAGVYDWNSGEETTLDLAPDTNLPDVFTIAAPLNVAADSGTAQLFLAADGTVVSRILVTWSASANAFVLNGGRVLVEFKPGTSSQWESLSAQGSAVQTYINAVEDGAAYDIRVSFENTLGVRSEATQIAHTVVGKTAPPSDVASFTISGTLLSFSEVADLDLAGYRVRYQPGTTRSWGDAIPLHTGLLTHSPFDMLVVPSGPVTIMIKAVDTSNNESLTAAYISTELGDPLVANVVEQFDRQADGWPGTLTDGSIDGSNNLVADSTVLMWNANSAANWWSVDSAQLFWPAASYARMTYEDRILVSAALAGSRMTIAATVAGDPWSIYFRENSTNPMWSVDGATPLWSDDAALFWYTPMYLPWPGELVVENTIYDFLITAGQGPTQGEVSAFIITIDAPDLEETLDDVSILAAGTRLPITLDFAVIKNVQLTVQADGGTAISARSEDKNAALGPLVKCLDAAGVAVNGLIDARVQGY